MVYLGVGIIAGTFLCKFCNANAFAVFAFGAILFIIGGMFL